MNAIITILGCNILPIFIIVGIGSLIGKNFNMNLNTLSKLNFYVFVPSFMFVNLYTTNIPITMIKVIFAALLLVVFNFIIGAVIGKLRNYDDTMTKSFQNCIMFYNSGNIGVPLITLVFSSAPFLVNGETIFLDMALTMQIMVLLVQNITTNSIGFYNAGSATMKPKESLLKILKMPTIYTIPIALLLKLIPVDLTTYPGWSSLEYLKQGVIPIALLALGIELSQSKLDFKNRKVYLTVFIRTIIGPIMALAVAYIFGFTGAIGQAFLISSSVPTAVNVALIAIEYKNNEEYSTQVVMFSTLFSALTLSLVIFMARMIFPI